MSTHFNLKLDAEWRDDCSGKKDYDGHILSISTRYWPAGGGFLLVDNRPQGVVIQEGVCGIMPSAGSSLIIRGNDETSICLTKQEFEGDTFAEIAVQVEAWAQEQMDKAVAALTAAFIDKERRC